MLLFVALCVWSDLGKLRLQAMAGRRVFCWQTLLMKVRCRLWFSYRFIDLDPVLKVYVYIPASTSSCYFLGNDWKPGFPSQSPVLPISWYQPWPPRPFCSPLRRRSGLHQAARAPKTVDQVFFFWTWYIMIWQWPNMIDERLGSQSKAWWEFQCSVTFLSVLKEREGERTDLRAAPEESSPENTKNTTGSPSWKRGRQRCGPESEIECRLWGSGHLALVILTQYVRFTSWAKMQPPSAT